MPNDNTNDKKSPEQKREKPLFRLGQIKSLDDPRVEGFIKVYKDAFSGPPYFENYTDEYVRDKILAPHIPFWAGIASTDEGVIGLCCVHPFDEPVSLEATDYVRAQPKEQTPIDLSISVYGSEFATSSNVRKLGVGGALMCRAFRWAHENGYPYAIMRTAADGSNSVRMLVRAGGVMLPYVQEVGDKGIGSKSDKRVWLYIETAKFADYGKDMDEEDPTEAEPETTSWLCGMWKAVVRFFRNLWPEAV
jgi:GNAT superfamily N-acetyltransferase